MLLVETTSEESHMGIRMMKLSNKNIVLSKEFELQY